MRKKYDAALLARTSTSLLLILFIPSICRDAKIEYPIVENQMSERRLTHEEMSSDVDRNSASSQANGLKRREGFMMEVVKIAEVIVNFFEVCMFCRSKKNETITPFFLITSYYSRSHMRN